ncbi:MAG: hypothetical protein J7507_16950 [Pseudoxanthomonas sp.]|nr:hypothetical protein [Pseudoxanthomonas sp.]
MSSVVARACALLPCLLCARLPVLRAHALEPQRADDYVFSGFHYEPGKSSELQYRCEHLA